MRFSAFQLKSGTTYEVTKEFVDFDGRPHPVGERWRFLSHNFFPYDAGLTLFVEGDLFSIRLQDYPEMQGPIIDHFSDFVAASASQGNRDDPEASSANGDIR